MIEPTETKVPVSFWIVSGLSLLWNGFGGYDYFMTRTRNLEYLSQMGDPKEMLAWIDSFPVWATLAWPIGVWGSVVGSVLLLLRSRHAVTAFVVSLAGAVVSFGAQMIITPPASLDTAMNKVMPVVILAIIYALWWYSRRSAARGILR